MCYRKKRIFDVYIYKGYEQMKEDLHAKINVMSVLLKKGGK